MIRHVQFASTGVCVFVQVLLKDGATIEVGAEVLYRVKNVILSVSNVKDLNHTTRNLSHSVLQKVVRELDYKWASQQKHATGCTVRVSSLF